MDGRRDSIAYIQHNTWYDINSWERENDFIAITKCEMGGWMEWKKEILSHWLIVVAPWIATKVFPSRMHFPTPFSLLTACTSKMLFRLPLLVIVFHACVCNSQHELHYINWVAFFSSFSRFSNSCLHAHTHTRNMSKSIVKPHSILAANLRNKAKRMWKKHNSTTKMANENRKTYRKLCL